nr:CsiV family protein [Oceanobacter mangrovi]
MFFRPLLAVATGLMASSALAENALFGNNWYDVEMMLVAYTDLADIDNEHWDKLLAPEDLPAAAVSDPLTGKSAQPSAVQQAYRLQQWQQNWAQHLPWPVTASNGYWSPLAANSHLRMQREASRIDPQGGMRVVWHERWIEPVQAQAGQLKHPINLTLDGEPEIQISGSFSIYLSRYLHIHTDLAVQHLSANLPQEPLLMPVAETTDSLLATAIDTTAAINPVAEPVTVIEQPEPQPVMIDGLYPARAAHIVMSRRMRSGELHYLDHPMLGLVIRLTPVDIPEPAPAPTPVAAPAAATTSPAQ